MVEGGLRLAPIPLHRRSGGPPPRAGEDIFPARLRLAAPQILAQRPGEPPGPLLVVLGHGRHAMAAAGWAQAGLT
jgi:hypothetical protein